MNLIDAIKSGRPFRRKGDKGWLIADDVDLLHDVEEKRTYIVEDILADDWEIQEPTVTISRSQLQSAFDSLVESHKSYDFQYVPVKAFGELARKLGLEDSP